MSTGGANINKKQKFPIEASPVDKRFDFFNHIKHITVFCFVNTSVRTSNNNFYTRHSVNMIVL